MLNMTKFTHNFRINIQGFLKDTHEWTNEGQGQHVQSSDIKYFNGYFDVDVTNVQMIAAKILEHLNKNNRSDIRASDLGINDNFLEWCQLEDKECTIIKDVDISEQSLEKYYLCDYCIIVFINGIELIESDLMELFPNSCH